MMTVFGVHSTNLLKLYPFAGKPEAENHSVMFSDHLPL